MAARRVNPSLSTHTEMPPAPTPEAREAQLQSLAYDLAEKQLREGTASAQVITQFLKSGSSRERLEQSKMDQEVELLKAKSEMLEAAKAMESTYRDALNAMRAYSGSDTSHTGDDLD